MIHFKEKAKPVYYAVYQLIYAEKKLLIIEKENSMQTMIKQKYSHIA